MIALILAGGENSRYPGPKGLIEVHGSTIVQSQVDIFRQLGLQPLISTNTPEHYFYLGLPMIGDIIERAGPLSGIVSAFEYTGATEIFVTACDMPFIKPEMIQYIIGHRGGPATVALYRSRPEPLLAVYTKEAARTMRKMISLGRTSVRDLTQTLGASLISEDEINKIDPAGESFVNINTPEEYRRALAMRQDTAGT